MHTDRVEGAMRVIAGKCREVVGRLLNDSSLETRGRAERLSGEVELACVRVRSMVRP